MKSPQEEQDSILASQRVRHNPRLIKQCYQTYACDYGIELPLLTARPLALFVIFGKPFSQPEGLEFEIPDQPRGPKARPLIISGCQLILSHDKIHKLVRHDDLFADRLTVQMFGDLVIAFSGCQNRVFVQPSLY